jgi:hypothetical protein
MNRFLILIYCTLLSSCASNVSKTYTDKDIPDSKISIIKGVNDSTYKALFYSIYGKTLEGASVKKAVGGPFIGYPSEIRALPGVYYINAYCTSGYVYSYPAFDISVEAGKTYLIGCESVPNMNATRAVLHEVVESSSLINSKK